MQIERLDALGAFGKSELMLLPGNILQGEDIGTTVE